MAKTLSSNIWILGGVQNKWEYEGREKLTINVSSSHDWGVASRSGSRSMSQAGHVLHHPYLACFPGKVLYTSPPWHRGSLCYIKFNSVAIRKRYPSNGIFAMHNWGGTCAFTHVCFQNKALLPDVVVHACNLSTSVLATEDHCMYEVSLIYTVTSCRKWASKLANRTRHLLQGLHIQSEVRVPFTIRSHTQSFT